MALVGADPVQDEIRERVKRMQEMFANDPQAARIEYRFGGNWSGELSLFVDVALSATNPSIETIRPLSRQFVWLSCASFAMKNSACAPTWISRAGQRMVDRSPEELLEQAELLLSLSPNQANIRRATSAASYSVLDLLIRWTVLMWSGPLHQWRIARIFDHGRMINDSGATTKDLKFQMPSSNPEDNSFRTELANVTQVLVFLQQARHEADYNLEKPLALDNAWRKVARARAAFESWKRTDGSEVAKEYLS